MLDNVSINAVGNATALTSHISTIPTTDLNPDVKKRWLAVRDHAVALLGLNTVVAGNYHLTIVVTASCATVDLDTFVGNVV